MVYNRGTMKQSMQQLYSARNFFAGAGMGFVFFLLTSHPNSQLHKRIPKKSIKSLRYSPHIVVTKNKTDYHFHHWGIMTTLYAMMLILKRMRPGWTFIEGILIGSIVQGLVFPDRFRFRNHSVLR